MIHLGYETGTGKPVSIPLAHMAVTGQTQYGKTTTLEAIIERSGVHTVVFVTKPGEKSFSEGRRILPFFKERADWEYVKELLEARRNESLSKWDGYLMRVCSRARTLQDVRNNVQRELPKKKSARPSHYEVLAGYLDLIIPELDRVPYTDKLDLKTGVNIMDLSGSLGESGIRMSDDMQAMVIRSTIEHIHKRERNTVLVMPEAWKFIPEGGRSAVFQALHGLIREGATNGNFVWIDAQDLAIVSKRILKSVTVWILGKQQEANEVARTINHLIEPLQIRPDMIKSLGVGQFLICAESQPARRVYVQPRWLGDLDAMAIARGEESVETAQAIFRQKKRELAARPALRQVQILEQTEPVKNGKAESKIEKRAGTMEGIQRPAGADVSDRGGTGPDRNDPNTHQSATAASATRAGRIVEDSSPVTSHQSPVTDSEDEKMWKERAEKAETEVATLKADVENLRKLLNDYRVSGDYPRNGSTYADSPVPCDEIAPDGELCALAVGHAGKHSNHGPFRNTRSIPSSPVTGNGLSPTQEKIYRYVIKRAEEEPRLLKILTTKRELLVQIETPTLEVDGATLRGGLALLIHKGFFSTPKNGNTAWNELQRLGRRTAKPNVYRELGKLAEDGFLTSETDGFQATDLKVTVKR
jgi:hypothetical protein